jgi:CMP-N-acetylneuraminic acid synthetase
LPGKNIKDFFGRPLIAYTIDQALASKYVDRVIVSTESKKIADVAVGCGAEVPFLRPKRLASDKSGTIDVLLHVIKCVEREDGRDYDTVLLLHANTPLRATGDIDNCITRLFESGAENLFSVTEAHRNPYFNMARIDKNGWAKIVNKGDFVSRQAAPRMYDLNSSIYVWRKDALKKKRGVFLAKSAVYVMPKERSVDIDDRFDWEIAKLFFKKYAHE